MYLNTCVTKRSAMHFIFFIIFSSALLLLIMYSQFVTFKSVLQCTFIFETESAVSLYCRFSLFLKDQIFQII